MKDRKLKFLELPPEDTIQGMAIKYLGSDGRDESSPTVALTDLEPGDTIAGFLPNWKPVAQIPEEAAQSWIYNSAPDAVMSARGHHTFQEGPLKEWGHRLTVIVGTMPDTATLENREKVIGIRKSIIEVKKDKSRRKTKESIYTIYQSPSREVK